MPPAELAAILEHRCGLLALGGTFGLKAVLDAGQSATPTPPSRSASTCTGCAPPSPPREAEAGPLVEFCLDFLISVGLAFELPQHRLQVRPLPASCGLPGRPGEVLRRVDPLLGGDNRVAADPTE